MHKKLLIETITHDILTIVKKRHPEYIVNTETEEELKKYLEDSHIEMTDIHIDLIAER